MYMEGMIPQQQVVSLFVTNGLFTFYAFLPSFTSLLRPLCVGSKEWWKDGTSFLCTMYIFWRRESSFNGTHPHRIMFLLECCCCLQKSPPHEFDLGLSVQHLRETSHYFKPLKKKIMHLSKAHTRIFPPSRFVAPFFDPFLGSSLIS